MSGSLREVARAAYIEAAWLAHRALFRRNADLVGQHQGERGFVVLNGSSLRDIDLSVMRDEISLACNHVMRHPAFPELRLKYYAEMHSLRACQTSTHEDNRIERIMGALKSGMPQGHKFVGFFHWTLRDPVAALLGDSVEASYYFLGRDRSVPKAEGDIDLTRPIPFMQGTAHFLLATAIMMGLKEIFLLGAGYACRPYQWGHFYDPASMFPRGVKDEVQEIEPMHYWIKRLSEIKHARIINVVSEGYTSPVYDSISVAEFHAMMR